MKFIHCSDIHLDSKMEANLDPIKARDRRSEILQTFSNMIKYAKEQSIKVILIAGDLFDSTRVTNNCKEYVLNLIKFNEDIDFLYLVGNHDEDNVFNGISLKNLKLFKDEWTTYKYKDVSFTGIKLGSNPQDIYSTLHLDKDNVNIVCLHGQETKNQTAQEDNINLKLLSNKNIDYLALGHIHSYRSNKLDKRGIYCYCGCLEGRGFDECGDKGFVVVEIEGKKVSHNFIKFASRCFYEIEADITGLSTTNEVEDLIINLTEDINNNNLVKVVIKGSYLSSSIIDIIHLDNILKKKFYFSKVYNKSHLALDIESIKYDISLKGEFIRNVLDSTISEDEKNEIISLGLKALRGEDL